MPPPPKFTRQQIVDAAIGLINEKGIEALTARELAARLGSSARPIFTAFRDMDDLKDAIRQEAHARLGSRMSQATGYTPAFKQAGMEMILFAMQEPRLFQMLYMDGSEAAPGFDALFSENGGEGEFMGIIQRQYGLSGEEAKALFQHVWIYTYGISVLCATGMCTFSEDQLVRMLGADFGAMMGYIKSGKLNAATPTPRPMA